MQNRPPARTASRQPTTVKPATLKAVAAAAGVHLSTASRALDPAKRHLIAAEVAARIEAEARRLGYRRDAAAASLRTRRSRLVGVLVPDIANPVFSPIISGVSESLSAQGYSTIVADVGSDPKRQAALVDELIARRVDGLILATVRRDDAVLRHCLETRLPVVLVNRADESGRVPAVVSDDLHGMKLAVDHLVALGHRRIGHIAGPAHLSTGHLRRQGFEAAMKAHGLKIPAGGISTAKAYEREAGESAAAALLDIKPRLSAIVAANDLLALGLLRALRARGLTCPGDLSVVGHNDMPLVDMIDPPLTTVRIGPREMGQDAAKLLLSALEGQPGDPAQRVMLRPTLIPRASTAALK